MPDLNKTDRQTNNQNTVADAQDETAAEYLKEQIEHLLKMAKEKPDEHGVAPEKESEALGAYNAYPEEQKELEKALPEEQGSAEPDSPKEEELTLRPDAGLKVVSHNGIFYLIGINAEFKDLDGIQRANAHKNYTENFNAMIENYIAKDSTKTTGLGHEALALTLSSVDDRPSAIRALKATIDNQEKTVQSYNNKQNLSPAGSNVDMPPSVSIKMSPLPSTPKPEQQQLRTRELQKQAALKQAALKQTAVKTAINNKKRIADREEAVEALQQKNNINQTEEGTAPQPFSTVPRPYDKYK